MLILTSLIGSSLLAVAPASVQAPVPEHLELLCTVTEEVSVANSNLSVEWRGGATFTRQYRFSGGKLYLTPTGAGREEYFYGDVILVEYLRYTSGYKTVVFSDGGFSSATSVHVDQYPFDTRMTSLRCDRHVSQ